MRNFFRQYGFGIYVKIAGVYSFLLRVVKEFIKMAIKQVKGGF